MINYIYHTSTISPETNDFFVRYVIFNQYAYLGKIGFSYNPIFPEMKSSFLAETCGVW
jgi:hypothetical protein